MQNKPLNINSREDLENNYEVEIMLALMSGRLTNAVNRKLSREFHKSGLQLSASQSSILFALWRENGMSQKQLSDFTFKDKPNITRLLDKMEEDGLVERKKCRDDRRTNKIYLTDKAKNLSEPVFDATIKAVKDAFAGLSEDQASSVLKMVKLIFNNLEADDDGEIYEED